jgi:hypothetical protein
MLRLFLSLGLRHPYQQLLIGGLSISPFGLTDPLGLDVSYVGLGRLILTAPSLLPIHAVPVSRLHEIDTLIDVHSKSALLPNLCTQSNRSYKRYDQNLY